MMGSPPDAESGTMGFDPGNAYEFFMWVSLPSQAHRWGDKGANATTAEGYFVLVGFPSCHYVASRFSGG